MKIENIISTCRLLAIVVGLALYSGCEPDAAEQERQKAARNANPECIEGVNFSFVIAKSGDPKQPEAELLNQWLRKHAEKRVLSFAEIAENQGGAKGYVLYTENGSNERQLFVKLSPDASQSWDEKTGFGIQELQQQFSIISPATKIVSIAAVPKNGGGLQSYTILYETDQLASLTNQQNMLMMKTEPPVHRH